MQYMVCTLWLERIDQLLNCLYLRGSIDGRQTTLLISLMHMLEAFSMYENCLELIAFLQQMVEHKFCSPVYYYCVSNYCFLCHITIFFSCLYRSREVI